MSFDNNKEVVVYNLYGQRIVLRIATRPNWFGYIDILDDEVGNYCLKHLYTQAIQLHNFDYADRFVGKAKRREEWEKIHYHNCAVCDHRDRITSDLSDDGDDLEVLRLRDLFSETQDVVAPLRHQKMALLPKPNPATAELALLPSDEEVILSLRREICSLKVKLLTECQKHQTEMLSFQKEHECAKNELKWYQKECAEGTRIIRKAIAILEAIPPEIVEKAEIATNRKSCEM